MLEISDIHTSYGNIRALKGISLIVEKGEIVTLIGANGAGKTTTLKTIIGTLGPQRGEIRFEGKRISGLSTNKVVRMGLAHTPEGRRIFPRMTVLENLELGAFARADKQDVPADLERVFTLFPRLKERQHQKGGTLSGGEQQMLAMGRALMGAPKLLMLDEPSLGLAPIIVADIFRTIGELRAAGVSVLLVEQNAQAALKIADQAYVMELGEFVLSGKAAYIAANERVAASYLGFEHEASPL